MTDGIIKGTGNSRYLKSVANALALYPTHESLMEALAAGTLPIDLNGINPAGWNTVGDKLDKATLLTDALCTALGISTTSTPTQAMDKLRQLVNTAQSTANGRARVSFGSYVGNGASSMNVYLPGTPMAVILSTDYGRFYLYSDRQYTYNGGILAPNYTPGDSNIGNIASISGSVMTVYNNSYAGSHFVQTNSGTHYYICFY